MNFLQRVRRAAAFRARRALFPPPIDDRLDELISIGRGSYPKRLNVLHFHTYTTRIDIGAFCSLANDVLFVLDADHRTDWITTYPIRIKMDLPGAGEDGHPRSRGDITVGNDVWISAGATILSGVTIGDGAVIGARAVVSRDVAPYAIAVGNPAAVARKRFSEEQISALLRIKWWEWPDDLVAERVTMLCSPDIQAFIDRFDVM